MRPTLRWLFCLCLVAETTSAADLILNEYNAVADGSYLNGGTLDADADGGQAADPVFGRVLGNGGDWFELVVVTDHLDIRGWQLAITDNGVPGPTLVLSDDALWADLRSGTIVTIAESVDDDPTFDPPTGDWWINVRAGVSGTGTYVSAIDFPVGNSNWQITIRAADGADVFGPAGEGVSPASGVGGTEVMKLEADPSANITPASGAYLDGKSSTFGEPNRWSGGTLVQDFSALRGTAPPLDPTVAMYDPTRIITVDIEIDPDDWNALRVQQRTIQSLLGGDCIAQPFESPFTWFPAAVTIDGQRRENAGVRKKGFLGSLDQLRPSLKLDLKEFGPNEPVHGLHKLTLNNDKQDPAHIRQCLGYGLFARAGVPAPRCNFVHVRVNGQDLGIYTNVEEIRRSFLARHFADDSGNLYEGTSSDFIPALVGTFEAQTNEDTTDRSDLAAVVAALGVDDAGLLSALAPLVDLHAFGTYWAMEALLGHWDGFTSNRNNFYVYNDPTSGRFHFMPWGLDGILRDGHPLGDRSGTGPETLFAYSAMPRRLMALPEVWSFYVFDILTLLDSVWDEAAILAEIDRMEALLAPIAGDLSTPIASVRSFVAGRRQQVGEELGAVPPSLPPLTLQNPCLVPNGTVRAGFVAFWGALGIEHPLTTGFATLQAQVGDDVLVPIASGAVAGLSGVDPNPHFAGLELHFWLTTGLFAKLQITFDSTGVSPGTVLAVDGIQVEAQLQVWDESAQQYLTIGLLDEGTLRFDFLSTEPGGWLYGVIDAGSYWPGFTDIEATAGARLLATQATGVGEPPSRRETLRACGRAMRASGLPRRAVRATCRRLVSG